MDSTPTPTNDKEPRDATYWTHTSTLKVSKVPTGALNLNVEGRKLLSPLQGFGQLWQKTFRVHLTGTDVKPAEVIQMWKENFPKFWPKWDHYYLPQGGIAPGQVGLINMLIPGNVPVGLPLSTGVMIIYSDEESFTFMSPQGLMFAGWITFSAYETDEGYTIAQIRMQVRANDPAYEIGFRLGATRSENWLWQHVLKEIAAHYAVTEPVTSELVCIDPRVQWSQFWNIWQNAAIRTFLYRMLTPVRWTIKRVSPRMFVSIRVRRNAWISKPYPATKLRGKESITMSEPIIRTEHGTTKVTSTSSSKLKTPPRLRSYSLLGSASQMQRDPLSFLMQTNRLGDVVGMRFVFSDAYLIYHPDSVKHVLQENHRNYNKDVLTYKLFRPFLGLGLVTNDGDSWLHQRRLIQPAFHRKRLATYGTWMTDATTRLIEQWQARPDGDEPLNVAEEMMRLTLGIVGQALFSVDLSHETSTVGPAVTTLVKLLGDYIYNPFPPLSIPTSRNHRMLAAKKEIDEVVDKIIVGRRQHNIDTGDLLSMLLMARDEETGHGMSDQQVHDEVITLLNAGHETTANALVWTWYLLSQHPDVDQRLYEELDTVLHGNLPTVEHLPDLKYTRMVIEESMRLYPPFCVISRKAIADDELRGYRIPANSVILVSPYATQHDSEFWPDPEHFDPERFTPELVANRPHYAYFPFAGGPRMCIGSNFSMMEAQLVVATIAQRYQLRMVPGHPVEPQMKVTLRPKYGLLMTIHER